MSDRDVCRHCGIDHKGSREGDHRPACDTCQHHHRPHWRHCTACGRASAFIGPRGRCLGCKDKVTEPEQDPLPVEAS